MRILSLFLLLCLWVATQATPAMAGVVTVQDVRYDKERGMLVVEADGRVTPRVTRLTNPDRVVIDLPGSTFERSYLQLESIDGTPIQRVRVGQYLTGTTRIVLDLARPGQFEVQASGNTLLIPTRGTAASAPRPEATDEPDRPAAADVPVLRSISVSGGNLVVGMSARRPYWSHVEPGTPSRYTVVYPNVKLAPSLNGIARAVNSHGIIRWRARQVGDDARIELDMTRVPDFDITALSWGWRFAQENPKPNPPSAVGLPPTDAPLTLRKVGEQWQLVLTADRRFTHRLTAIGEDRLQVDLSGARVSLPRDSVYIDNGLIARVRMSALPGGNTRLTIDLDQPVRYSARMLGNYRSLLLSLSRVGKDAVTVDPGHGGSDHGAIGGSGTREKDVTLAIATRLSRIMATNGISVQMTRMKDLEILLRPRVEMANRNDSDVFISIHANSFGSHKGVKGIETYYFSDDSYELAKAVHQQLISTLKAPDRGVRKNNFYVVHHTKMPSALVEIGYLSNPEEEALLKDPDYQERAAKAIYSGIQEFLKDKQQKH